MSQPGKDLSKELVESAQRGDRDALNERFAFSWPQVLQAVRRKMGSRLRRFQDSYDVVQGTLEEAFRQFKNFQWQGEGSFKYWLYTLARNRLRKDAHFYSAKKRGGGKLPGFLKTGRAGDGGFRPADTMTGSRLAQMNERKIRVRLAMDRLDREKREILELREYLGLSHMEIGQALRLEPDAARMRVVRAKEALVKAIMEVKQEEQPRGKGGSS